MCTRSAVFGFKQYANGGFAEYVRLDKNCINHKVPRGFTPEQAVLIEPIACGMHAVERAQIQHSDVVVIAGLGAIGTSMVNIASLALPKMVIGIDVKDNRLEMGKSTARMWCSTPPNVMWRRKFINLQADWDAMCTLRLQEAPEA